MTERNETAQPAPLCQVERGVRPGSGAQTLVKRLRLQWPDTPHRRDALHREAADEIERLRTALLDANQICRSAWSISNRIATEYSTNEMGTYFGAFSERTHESLKRQHEVILATGGYPKPDGA